MPNVQLCTSATCPAVAALLPLLPPLIALALPSCWPLCHAHLQCPAACFPLPAACRPPPVRALAGAAMLSVLRQYLKPGGKAVIFDLLKEPGSER